MREKISFATKLSIAVFAVGGVLWSLVNASADGYSHPAKRLLYFTGLSNIWIAAMMLVMVILPRIKSFGENTRVKNTMYLLRFILTVSITLTGFIFCAVLAPGAGNVNYNAWTPSSIITHIIVPTLSVFDLFFDPYRFRISKKQTFYTLIPPFIYLVFVSILVLLKVDFGRGDPYPYIFFNYYSPAGFFGFSSEMPYIFGSFYWILLMLGGIIGVSFLYRKFYNK